MRERLAAAGRKLRQWSQQREPWMVLLVLCALCYFGSYYRHGLNFKDEGGTEVLIAKRLLEGERPLVDVALGYNVMWFYPIVGLFKLFGVSYVLLRVYCFGLSTITALLAFLTLERAGRRPWIAFFVSLLLVVVPGMTFKNYMPLLAVGNAFCLLHFAIKSRPGKEHAQARMWRWIVVGGLALGLTFLIRIDVGLFCGALWVLGCLVAAWQWRATRGAALRLALGAPAAIAALVVAVHLPIYIDAQRRGFADQFLAQYSGWPKSLLMKAGALLGKAPAPARPPGIATLKATPPPLDAPIATPVPKGTPAASTKKKAPPAPKGTLARKELMDLLEAGRADQQLLVVLLYAPIFGFAVLLPWALFRLWRGLVEKDHRTTARALGAVLMLGMSLTTFPQYFFFRPDSPHLSEFSPGFWVAVAGTLLLIGHWRSWATRLLVLLFLVHAGAYLWRMLPDRWTGTAWVRKSRTFRFRAANGVDVLLNRREMEGATVIKRLVAEYSKPGEYLVAYPYHPTVNVMTDRPTYEKNVYIDNATSHANWDLEAIKRFEQYQPAVIVLSDWDVNGTRESRFSVWAERAKTWVQSHYTFQGSYLEMEIYTRDAAPLEPAK